MHLGFSMKKAPILTILFVTLFAANSIAQVDSSITDRSFIDNAIRAGVGIEKSPYFELGFSKIGIVDKAWAGSFCFYAAAQLNMINSGESSSNYYGGKVGFETAWMIGMLGAEIKYLTNNKQSQVYFTPKVGLSALGFVDANYIILMKIDLNKTL
jgi:hypothetical protein